jgi:exopolysaccharide biosynthesis polyprenyl glycosylphosphotransferase
MSTPTKAIETSFTPAQPVRWRSMLSVRLPFLLTVILVAVALLDSATAPWLAAAGCTTLCGAGAIVQQRRRRSGNVILIGRTTLAAVLANSLESGLLTPGRKRRALNVFRAPNWSEASTIARSEAVDEVIVAESMGPNPIRVIDARGRMPKVVDGTDKLEGVLGRVPLELAERDRWFTHLGAIRPISASYERGKRALDLLFVAGVGLAVLPVIPLIALAIKLDSRGPVFYSQTRVGLGGRHFRIYKFRTMRQDAERHGAVWATKADPRITRAGKFMRRTRIDEIPQIWNVLKGEMAVVGPRPERPEFTTELAKEIAGYDLRHTVKPGLTGWAQVCYRYTSSIRDTKAKVEYDLYYVKHLSMMMDIRILFRTIKVVIGMKGQ